MKLRPYQEKAVAGVFDAWRSADSTLIVMPTGTGKTIVLAHVIDQRAALGTPGRAMLLAHREELIWQGASKIAAVTGIQPDVEMAELIAADSLLHRADVVVSSIQTQNSGRGKGRMARFDPMQFSLLIIDEAHHGVADSYRRVIDHYRKNPKLKVLGVTATPDRTDEEALGQIFETVAFDYELIDAIRDGWLVPIQQRAVHVDGLDLSTVKTTAGDLNGADLARVMEYEEALHGIASPTLDLIGSRKTLLFAASVAHAERLCEIFNRHRCGMARFVCGKTAREERRSMLADYAAGRFQVLCNVGVATEGFDDPGIQVVVMARPTKSRSLYCQMAGRGTRPLPGIVDGFEENEQAAGMRRAAIAASDKPAVEIIDFVGNAGRHKLMTTADILGGNYSDAVVERARANAEIAGKAALSVDMAEALAQAEAELKAEREEAARAARLALRVKARYSTSLVNPFELLNIEPWQERGWNKGRPPSDKQLACLEKFGVGRDQVQTFTQASQLISELIGRRQGNRCTVKQARILARNGYGTDVSFDQARELIDQIAREQGWGQRRQPAPAARGGAPGVRVY